MNGYNSPIFHLVSLHWRRTFDSFDLVITLSPCLVMRDVGVLEETFEGLAHVPVPRAARR